MLCFIRVPYSQSTNRETALSQFLLVKCIFDINESKDYKVSTEKVIMNQELFKC